MVCLLSFFLVHGLVEKLVRHQGSVAAGKVSDALSLLQLRAWIDTPFSESLEPHTPHHGEVQVHQNHFDQKPHFIRYHFSSKTTFIKNQLHQSTSYPSPEQQHIVRVCVKASPSHKHGLCPPFRF